MKILLLTQVLPYPPDSGPKVKTWNLIQYLARQHEVTLVSFVRGDQSREVEQLRRFCAGVFTVPMERGALRDGVALLKSLVTGAPWVIARDARGAMFRLVREVSAREAFDAVHADQLNMAQYALAARAGKKVLDTHNALWLLYRRMASTMPGGLLKRVYGRDWRLLRRYEGKMCQVFDAVLAVSEEDRRALEEVSGTGRKFHVVPISVNTDEVRPVRRVAEAERIVTIGTMFWQPNVDGIVWFVQSVLPLIRREKPDAALDIIGARPPKEVVALAEQDGLIRVTGYVEDPLPFLEQAGVMVVPLRAGGGMRVKILNALAQGLPVVTTSIGCEGIVVEHGRHVLIADTPAEFARAVVQVLKDRSLASDLGRCGRHLIETLYDYRVACRSLDDIYPPDGK